MVSYDGGQNVRDEERSVGRKKLDRKAELPASTKKGFGWPSWAGFHGRTVWDWLVLLLAAIVTTQVTFVQTVTTQNLEQDAQMSEDQRAQDAAVQNYTDQMLDLFATSNYLDEAQEDETRTLARARTLAALRKADLLHKKSIIRFLYDARLIQGNTSPVSLSGADLTDINLSDVDLSRANLSGADLHNSALDATDLSDALLSEANLDDATGITNEELEQQAETLEGATMPDGQKYEEWLKSKDRGEDG